MRPVVVWLAAAAVACVVVGLAAGEEAVGSHQRKLGLEVREEPMVPSFTPSNGSLVLPLYRRHVAPPGGTLQAAHGGIDSDTPMTIPPQGGIDSDTPMTIPPQGGATDNVIGFNSTSHIFFLTAFLGTGTAAEEPYFLAIDSTHSQIEVFACNCEFCGSFNHCYNMTASPSGHNLLCNATMGLTCETCTDGFCGYSDLFDDYTHTHHLLWTGDRMDIGMTSADIEFGRVVFTDPALPNNVTNALDGTFGMALSATPGYVSPFRALVLAGEISNSFSMCLSTTGGVLVLGGFDTQYTLDDFFFVSLLEQNTFSVRISGVMVGNLTAPINEFYYSGVVLDTNRLGLSLPTSEVLHNLVTTFRNASCHAVVNPEAICGNRTIFEECMVLSLEDLTLMPNLTVALPGFNLVLSHEQYLLYNADRGVYCSTFDVNLDNTIRMGQAFLHAYTALIDLDGARVGFVRNTASSCHNSKYTIKYLSGNNQTATIGNPLPAPFRVYVANSTTGEPAVGVPVNFTVLGGTLQSTIVHTDDRGIASAAITLDFQQGLVHVNATVVGALNSPIAGVQYAVDNLNKESLTWFVWASIFLAVGLIALIFIYRVTKGRGYLHQKKWNTLNLPSQRHSEPTNASGFGENVRLL